MIQKGSIVRINLNASSLKELDDNVIKDIEKWDKECNGRHLVTNIHKNKMWTKEEIIKYELDGQYVFFENELIELREV